MVSAKMRKVIDIAEKLISENKKVIIWSQFSNSIEILEKQLLKYRAVTLYGQTENPETCC